MSDQTAPVFDRNKPTADVPGSRRSMGCSRLFCSKGLTADDRRGHRVSLRDQLQPRIVDLDLAVARFDLHGVADAEVAAGDQGDAALQIGFGGRVFAVEASQFGGAPRRDLHRFGGARRVMLGLRLLQRRVERIGAAVALALARGAWRPDSLLGTYRKMI
jgi:hypothetical protein